ncbi:hypothetical protein E3N88_11700 [Mikania micrantha]|uniref:Integrase catalytic domain-containing protein n=1 Tax=Mikania micrantha TaxID=192012 RepID=A0A5N6P581_9ASTR|nr:hypothetical protein E3N88_11700 [Mikania micrantha]
MIDYICRGHILNGMLDALFDVHQNDESARQLRDALESKYIAEDTSSKKFLVSNFMNYKMSNSMPVMEQYNELLHTLGQFSQHDMKMDESINIWSHLRIEESLRSQEVDKTKGKNQVSSSVNVVEDDGKFKKFNTLKDKRRKFNNDNNHSNKKVIKACWRCGKSGHFKKDFQVKLSEENKANAAGPSGSKDLNVKPGSFLVSDFNSVKNYVSFISESFYVQDDEMAWWVDSGATSHVCKDLRWFEEFKPIEDGFVLRMGNVATEPIKGIGKVSLVFTYGKKLLLDCVLYVPGIRKNLLSGIVLNSYGFKQVIESDKFIVSKHGTFVGFGYLSNGMFKLNTHVPFASESVHIASSSSRKVDHVSKLWHAKLDVKRDSKVLELIHPDLCDFHSTPSLGNKKFVVTYIDDATRYCYVYLVHTKDEALEKFKVYTQETELLHGDLIKTLRTDWGGEYYDPVYFQSTGIIHQTTAPYTPQQNGVVERKNITLKEMVNSLAVVRITDPKRKNLGERVIDCIFIGYAENSKAYRFYVLEPNDYVSINTVIESRDAIFDEDRFTSMPRPKDAIQNSQSGIYNPVENVSLERNDRAVVFTECRKSKRARKAKYFGHEFHLYLVEGTRNVVEYQYQYCFNIEKDPKTYNEEITSRDVDFWKEVIQDEMDSIMHNNTWNLIDLPPCCKPLGCKWIFKRKMKVDGSIDKFKAILVIQGFRQKEGINFFDTYASVARISTIRLLIALALIHKLLIHQMVVKTAFLNGELDEEVYMKQPDGFVLPGQENNVCKLIKSLYGLKQAPK